MTAFEIYLNGEKVCVAGIGQNDGVVTAILSAMTRPERSWVELEVGGLTSSTSENLKWFDSELHKGDVVRIKVLETANADKPRVRRPFDSKRVLANQKKYVRKMAKLFGWKLVKANNNGKRSAR